MPLFKRNNNPTVAEIESYYEQQNRRTNSTGRAWAMAILAILATIVFLALLFLGGRWIYNTLTDEDPAETTQQDVNSGTVDIDGFDSESNNSGSTTGSGGTVDDGAVSTDESNVDRIAGSDTDEVDDSTDNGSVAGNNTNIPNTGPGETALVIALISGVLATIASYRKKLL